MPCWFSVRIRVDDENIARDALRAMGLDPARHLEKQGKGFVATNFSPEQQTQFRMQYAKAATTTKAKKKYFTVASEETLQDGSIRITYESGSGGY